MADLVACLRDPAHAGRLDSARWSALISAARAEALLGTLACRLAEEPLPPPVAALFAAQRAATAQQQRQALWEAELARRALAPLGIVPVLLKGTAYVAAGLRAGEGRQIGDCDILVPRARIDAVEAALLGSGWQWLKPDPYDDAYYRRWMHELPPLVHGVRETMIDVHHSILPLTHRRRPDAAALLADALPTSNGLATLAPFDRIVHCAAHCLADGELDGGLRNLWDLHCLIAEQGVDGEGWSQLVERADRHQLRDVTQRAVRLAHHLYGSAIPAAWQPLSRFDRLIVSRLLARDDWGRPTRPALRRGFYLRGHWLRMPPLLLARHLWVKWQRA